MNPFFFGSSARRLFGLYTPAHAAGRGAGAKQRGLVLCPPWGQEYLRAHRSMRQLGSLLAAAGWHVLRFDYYGTGDSAGQMTEADLAGWRADIACAIDELKDTAGLSRVGLLGLRLGGTLATQVAVQRRKDVDVLVLWDPVVSGPDYLEELRRTDGEALARPDAAGGGQELLGFPMTAAMTHELRTTDLTQQLAGLPARTLVALTHSEGLLPSSAHERLRTALPPEATVETVEALPAWLEDHDSGAGAVPVRLLQRVVQWLG